MYIQNPGLQILEFIVFIWQMYTSLKHRETLTEEFPSPAVSNDVFPPVLFPPEWRWTSLICLTRSSCLWTPLNTSTVATTPRSHILWADDDIHAEKKTPDWKCEEINILPRFQPRLFCAGCENASRLILYVVLAYLKTLINHYNVLNLKYWCFKCIYVFARMFFLLLLFVRDPTGQVFYMKTFL